jgi:hypothetical protein
VQIDFELTLFVEHPLCRGYHCLSAFKRSFNENSQGTIPSTL